MLEIPLPKGCETAHYMENTYFRAQKKFLLEALGKITNKLAINWRIFA